MTTKMTARLVTGTRRTWDLFLGDMVVPFGTAFNNGVGAAGEGVKFRARVDAGLTDMEYCDLWFSAPNLDGVLAKVRNHVEAVFVEEAVITAAEVAAENAWLVAAEYDPEAREATDREAAIEAAYS